MIVCYPGVVLGSIVWEDCMLSRCGARQYCV